MHLRHTDHVNTCIMWLRPKPLELWLMVKIHKVARDFSEEKCKQNVMKTSNSIQEILTSTLPSQNMKYWTKNQNPTDRHEELCLNFIIKRYGKCQTLKACTSPKGSERKSTVQECSGSHQSCSYLIIILQLNYTDRRTCLVPGDRLHSKPIDNAEVPNRYRDKHSDTIESPELMHCI